MMEPLNGFKLVAIAPKGVRIVGMVQHEGRIIVATERAAYFLDGERFTPIQFAAEGEASKPGKGK